MQEKNNKKYILLAVIGLLLIIIAAFLLWWFLWNQEPVEEVEEVVEQTNVIDELGENDWWYVNDQVKIVITPLENKSKCEITWSDENTTGEIKLYARDDQGERRDLETTITDTSCLVAEDITDLLYIGVEIDTTDVGGLQPPDGGFSQVMYILPDNPTTVYPTSGQWTYTMFADSGHLSCSAASVGGITSSGPVSFTTSSHGMSANLNGDAAFVSFYRSAYATPHYQSPQYGNVSWELDVIDPENMTGTLHMQGEGCNGDYPITMSLDFPTVIPVYVPHQGSWLMEYGPLSCGGTPLDLGTMAGLPIGSSNLSITGGGPIPMFLSFSGGPGSIYLNQSLDTNNYNSFPNMYIGNALEMRVINNILTPVPFTVMGTFNAIAMSESQMIGTLILQGSNGCTGASAISLTSF